MPNQRTVPRTSFEVDRDDYKLVLNLLENATNAALKRDWLAVTRMALEVKSIMGKWDQSSAANHLFRKIEAAVKDLESKCRPT